MQLRDGRLALLVDAGLDGQLRSHFPELVRRLAGLRHPLSESALVRASELERLFAREDRRHRCALILESGGPSGDATIPRL